MCSKKNLKKKFVDDVGEADADDDDDGVESFTSHLMSNTKILHKLRGKSFVFVHKKNEKEIKKTSFLQHNLSKKE